ncbi:MAG: histidine ammonia-lyase [Flavobacteriales bacterium]|nr:histidine ammonia-lyase [Flavobacteriales bacterium]
MDHRLEPGRQSWPDLQALYAADRIALSDAARTNVARAHGFLMEVVASGQTVYGVNTGFGQLANVRVGADQLHQLQENILRSHAAGLGEPLPPEIVRWMLLFKVCGLIRGHSGVQPQTVDRLVDFYNEGLMPVVPRQGSLGASGDLAPLSHMCLPLMGEGELMQRNTNGEWKTRPAADVLQERGWSPIDLGPKEGLALINGTQMMSALLAHSLQHLEHLWTEAHGIASLSLAAFEGLDAPFHPAVHELRQHAGQQASAAEMRSWLEGAAFLRETHEWVQDPYSFRCIPQVYGALRTALDRGIETLEGEATAVTDNPILLPETGEVISAGNFHGEPLAVVLDHLKVAASELGTMSERRIFKLLSGTRGLPPFLASDPGLDSGLMIVQYTAASIVARNKMRAMPASVDTIDSSNGQEDHVSMGANAGLQLLAVIQGTQEILGCELLTASQALHFRPSPGLSAKQEAFIERFHQAVRPQDGDVEQSSRMRVAHAFLAR